MKTTFFPLAIIASILVPAATLAQAPTITTSDLKQLVDTPATVPAPPPITPDTIAAATFSGGPLPDGQSPLSAKIQILLDRNGISPGVIDGFSGDMTTTAIMALETQMGLPVDGLMDNDVWTALSGDTAAGLTTAHVIEPTDLDALSPGPLSRDYAVLAQMDQIGFTSLAEAIAEQYHMDEDFLRLLNGDARWSVGEAIVVVDPSVPGAEVPPTLSRIVVSKTTNRLQALNADGVVLFDYPVTVGSDATPSPKGTHTVRAVAMNPTYTYNPDVNFQQGDNTEPLILPPGPNGPVGRVWIDLSTPTYGLHGTPEPAQLFKNQSNGCVRLTNWDAAELAELVSAAMAVEGAGDITVTFTD